MRTRRLSGGALSWWALRAAATDDGGGPAGTAGGSHEGGVRMGAPKRDKRRDGEGPREVTPDSASVHRTGDRCGEALLGLTLVLSIEGQELVNNSNN